MWCDQTAPIGRHFCITSHARPPQCQFLNVLSLAKLNTIAQCVVVLCCVAVLWWGATFGLVVVVVASDLPMVDNNDDNNNDNNNYYYYDYNFDNNETQY